MRFGTIDFDNGLEKIWISDSGTDKVISNESWLWTRACLETSESTLIITLNTFVRSSVHMVMNHTQSHGHDSWWTRVELLDSWMSSVTEPRSPNLVDRWREYRLFGYSMTSNGIRRQFLALNGSSDSLFLIFRLHAFEHTLFLWLTNVVFKGLKPLGMQFICVILDEPKNMV